MPEEYQVVVQGSAEVPAFSEVFYTQVKVNDRVELKGMMDSGSMTCTLNEEAERILTESGALVGEPQAAERIVLVGCGGKQTVPKCIYDLTLTIYGVKCLVPVLVIPGQRDELIIGSNVLKHLMREMKCNDDYWKFVSVGCKQRLLDHEHFLDMMSCTTRWRGDKVPERIGTVKLPRAVTLLPQQEHMVWGRLPCNVPVSPGSTVIVEPCTSKTRPRDILIGRVITPMWGDRWVPMKMTNLSSKPITLRRNSKVADVSPCLAVEDLDIQQGSCKMEARKSVGQEVRLTAVDANLNGRLSSLGLSDLDIDSCDASLCSKRELVKLAEEYEDIFSRHSLDCGKAEGVVHRIRLTDDRPFRMPYRRVPPAHYQQLRQVLTEMEEKGIIRKSVKETLGRLRVVFQKVRDSHLKLSPKTCHLLRKSVKFLGHVIDQSGVSVDPTKVDAISNMPRATLMGEDGYTPSVKKLKSFLGMVFFYQSFIPGCSAIAKPLFALTAGMKRKGGWHVPEADHCRLEPCMPFILSVDVSLDGLGAVLSQLPAGEDKARPIAFASKTLSKSQQRYPAHRLEFMALKWSITEKFSHWLKVHDFTVWTDNNPLTHILTKPKLDAYEQRWVAKLSSYNFDLKYSPGPRNIVADALSRDPFASSVSKRLIQEPYSGLMLEVDSTETDRVQDAFRFGVQHLQVVQHSKSALATAGSCSSSEVRAALLHHSNWETAAGIRATHLIHHVQQLESAGQDTLPLLTLRELEDHQLQDPAVSSVLPFVVRRRRPSRRERCGMDARSLFMLKSWERLKVQDGILYRETRDPVSRTKRLQLVLPASLREKALEGVHDLAGHQGQVRTLHLARQRFFWPNMARDVKVYFRCCERCVFAKTPEPAARAPLESIKTSAPMELICIDFWSAEDKNKSSVDVLVATDHFTKMAYAFPCRNQTAKQVARKLWDCVFCVYGFPERIYSDQGASFESELVSELLQLSGVAKSHTTTYHPMGNGGTERFNRTLGNMLRALPLRAKQEWPQQIQMQIFAYNATIHETTGYAPFHLMFGRIPRLPVDVMFKSVLHDPVVADFSSYSKSLLTYLSEAARIAQQRSTKEQEHQACQYNKKVKGVSLQVGDRVLLTNKGERGKKKLADKWDPMVYTVIERNPKTHIYKISDVSGQCKVVHRNLLLDGHRLFLSLTLKYLTPDMTDHSQTYPDMTMMLRFEVE
ncbi:hypothetical protein AAFF_G00282470 [Aldrovandia affinis]|uniref:Gypsy retrotransposon integrase-like protein 1 n=1 Tax=Aldrovandia affinis TaxID=143900 RepID=A0AAD7T9T9_9TELE|nr:hypothetical protein AAFF_G00282470 [Aldrovandia affinis]